MSPRSAPTCEITRRSPTPSVCCAGCSHGTGREALSGRQGGENSIGLVHLGQLRPTDKAYTNQLKAARALEPLFKALSESSRYRTLSDPQLRLSADRRSGTRRQQRRMPDRAGCAACPPHAVPYLHPRRLLAGIDHGQPRVCPHRVGMPTFDAHHASDYMVYAYLQLAQDDAAAKAMQQSLTMKPIDNRASAFAYAAMPARIVLERGDWAAAAALPLARTAESLSVAEISARRGEQRVRARRWRGARRQRCRSAGAADTPGHLAGRGQRV